MTDWSFMKTGFDPTENSSEPDPSLVKAYASIFLTFTEHGLRHAGRYTMGKGRRVVSVDDIKRGMKYEVFKFMDRHDNLDNIEKWKKIIEEEEDDSDDDSISLDMTLSDADSDESQSNIEEEIDIMDVPQVDDKQIDKEFLEEMDNIDSRWDEWVPQNNIESALRDRINEMS